jgi:hypothetical protein
MTTFIIAITGRAGAGKNTLGAALVDYLRTHTTVSVCEKAFATALRDVAEAAFGCRYETHAEKERVDPFWGPWLEEVARARAELPQSMRLPSMSDEPGTGRRMLQFLGTEMFREMVHPEFWLLCFERRLAAMIPAPEVVVITDCRFNNEATWVRKHRGIVVEVVRRTQPPPTAAAHVSERGILGSLISERLETSSVDETRTYAALLLRRYVRGAA